MDRKKIKIYGGNGEYFIEDQYQKNNNCYCKDSIFDSKQTIFYYEDAYFYYDIDVDRKLLFKKWQ